MSIYSSGYGETFQVVASIVNWKSVYLFLCAALAVEQIETSLNLKDWTGDPCVPVPHTWVNCSATIPPTIQTV